MLIKKYQKVLLSFSFKDNPFLISFSLEFVFNCKKNLIVDSYICSSVVLYSSITENKFVDIYLYIYMILAFCEKKEIIFCCFSNIQV